MRASDAELAIVLATGIGLGAASGAGAAAAAGAYGLGTLATGALIGAASGAAEYFGTTVTAAAFNAATGRGGDPGPTVSGLAYATLGGAATGGLLPLAGSAGGAALRSAGTLARQGAAAAQAASGALRSFVYDTGLPFAQGFSRALAHGPLLVSADPSYSTAVLAILRGARGGVQELLEQSRRFERVARGYVRNELNETVIRSQRRIGAADHGFDFLSFSGTGAEARLFINEAKFVTGRVGSRKFSVFDLGRTASGTLRTRNFQEALGFAREAIEAAGLDDATTRTLLNQLQPGGSAVIRLFGSTAKGTSFDSTILDRIGRSTGFIAGHGFNL